MSAHREAFRTLCGVAEAAGCRVTVAAVEIAGEHRLSIRVIGPGVRAMAPAVPAGPLFDAHAHELVRQMERLAR